MIEQMKVGTVLTVEGNALPKIKEFTTSVRQAATAVEQLQRRLRPISEQFQKYIAQLDKLNPQMRRFYESASAGNRKITDFAVALRASNTEIASLSRHLGKVTAQMTALNTATATYKKESMAGGGGGIGGVHGRGLHAGPLSFVPGGAVGLGAAVVGYGAYKGFQEGMHYESLMAQASLQNIPGFDQKQVADFLNKNQVRGVSKTQMLQGFQEALTVTGKLKDSEEIAPILAKIRYGNSIYKGTKQEFGEADYNALIRIGEMFTGSGHAKELNPAFDMLTRINSSTSGQVKMTQWLMMMKNSWGSLFGSDPRVFAQLEPIVQELGGGKVGTGIRTLFAHMDAGRVSTAASKFMVQLGLVDEKDVEHTTTGRIKRIKPGKIHNRELLHKDLVDWVYNYYEPLLEKAGYKTVDQKKLANSILFTNTDLALVNTLMQNEQKVKYRTGVNMRAAGIDQTNAAAHNTTQGKLAELSAAGHDFNLAVSNMMGGSAKGGIDALIKILHAMTTIIKDLDRFFTWTGQVAPSIANYFSDKASPVTNSVKGWMDTVNKRVEAQSAPSQKPAQITVNVDGRSLLDVVLPHLNHGYYNAQLQGAPRFNPLASATPVGTTVPF